MIVCIFQKDVKSIVETRYESHRLVRDTMIHVPSKFLYVSMNIHYSIDVFLVCNSYVLLLPLNNLQRTWYEIMYAKLELTILTCCIIFLDDMHQVKLDVCVDHSIISNIFSADTDSITDRIRHIRCSGISVIWHSANLSNTFLFVSNSWKKKECTCLIECSSSLKKSSEFSNKTVIHHQKWFLLITVIPS